MSHAAVTAGHTFAAKAHLSTGYHGGVPAAAAAARTTPLPPRKRRMMQTIDDDVQQNLATVSTHTTHRREVTPTLLINSNEAGVPRPMASSAGFAGVGLASSSSSPPSRDGADTHPDVTRATITMSSTTLATGSPPTPCSSLAKLMLATGKNRHATPPTMVAAGMGGEGFGATSLNTNTSAAATTHPSSPNDGGNVQTSAFLQTSPDFTKITAADCDESTHYKHINIKKEEEEEEKEGGENARSYSKRLRTLPEASAVATTATNAKNASSLQTWVAAGTKVSFRTVEAKLDVAIAAADAAAAAMREAVFATIKESVVQQQQAAAAANTPVSVSASDMTEDCRMQITKVAEAVARGSALKSAKKAVCAVRTEAQELSRMVAAHNFQRVTALQQSLQALSSTQQRHQPSPARVGACAGTGAGVGGVGLSPSLLLANTEFAAHSSNISSSSSSSSSTGSSTCSSTTSPGNGASLYESAPRVGANTASKTDAVAAVMLAQAAAASAGVTGNVGTNAGAGVPPVVTAAAANAVAAAAATTTATITTNHQQPLERITNSQDTAADMIGDSQLYKVMTPEMLQANPTEWKTVWRTIAPQLNQAQHKRSKVLRRRALSCLYARRSRQKRAAAMNALVSTNTVLATENMYLQQKQQPGQVATQLVQQQSPQQQHPNFTAAIQQQVQQQHQQAAPQHQQQQVPAAGFNGGN